MALIHDLEQYQHPYVTVDGVLFRANGEKLEVKLVQNERLDGAWSLPGGFVSIDQLAIDTLREKMKEKANVTGFYAEQLQTYDALTRDERGRVLSIAYLCLTNDWTPAPGWFRLEDDERLVGEEGSLNLGDLAFDHGQIIRDARNRLVNKLWYSDLPKYLLPDAFKISEAKRLYEMLEGGRYGNGFERNMGSRLAPTGTVCTDNIRGTRPRLFHWGTVPQKGVRHVIH